jgi:hypothetical protein
LRPEQSANGAAESGIDWSFSAVRQRVAIDQQQQWTLVGHETLSLRLCG